MKDLDPAYEDASLNLPAEPRLQEDLVGHADIERLLADARNSGRLAHAWLLTGPRGIGKATLAYRFARAMLAGPTNDEPGLFAAPPPNNDLPPSHDLYVARSHPIFSRVASLGHADLMVLERGFDPDRKRQRSEIVIDDVRKLNAFFSLTAAEGGWRIAVVDAADEMNRNAANALLKVLEEPPPKSLLILVAHRADLLLPTLRSRCRRVRMQPLGDADTERLIAKFLPSLGPADRATLTRLAEGSPGRALRLAAAGGLELYGEFIDRLGQPPASDAPRLHGFADRLAQGDGESFRAFAELVDWWLSRMIRSAGMGELPPEAIEGEGAVMQHLLARRGLDQWVGVWENLNQLFDRAGTLALDRKQVVLNAFFALEQAGEQAP